MGKYGKKMVVSDKMENFVIGLLGPAGFGKSTLMFNVCNKLYGDDGYIAIDFGLEDGYSAIQGAVVEKCIDWDHFEEVVDDIVRNKEKEYPNLRVLICDTLDTAFECAENYCIKRYNREHMNDKDFKKAHSVNQIYGGFSGGYDAVIRTFKTAVGKLRSVGVGVFYTAHCKEKEFADMITGATYTQLTANMTNRYFNAVKDMSHIIGFGYYNRDVEHKDIGKTNPINNKKKGRDEISSECRKIKFRDDNYLVDAKSRFKEIAYEINLNTDEFINAIQTAINKARESGELEEIVSPKKGRPKKVEVETKVEEDVADEQLLNEEDVNVGAEDGGDEIFDLDEPVVDKAEIVKEIRRMFASADQEVKKKTKAILVKETEDGMLSEKLPIEVLNKIYAIVSV